MNRIPVFYDGVCEVCVHSMQLLRALDLLHRLEPVNFRSPAELAHWRDFGPQQAARAESELLILLPTGKWLGGFRAFRFMAWRLPLCWFVAPLLYLPGASLIGSKVYAWVAMNRYRLLGVHCGDSTCVSQKKDD